MIDFLFNAMCPLGCIALVVAVGAYVGSKAERKIKRGMRK